MATSLDDQFNLRKRHPFGRWILLLNLCESLVARAILECSLDVSYGESAGQRVDIFPAREKPAPVLVFIHGGYFRSLDKRHYRYIAQGAVRSGFTTVLVNYDLAPSVRVHDICLQILKAFAWIKQNIHRWNGDPDRLVLCGHSVGAFLVAKILEEDWSGLGGGGIEKAVLLSGLYDLEPMKRSYLNRDLNLTDLEVSNLSPQNRLPVETPKMLIAVGEAETEQFVHQSERYARRLGQVDIENELLVLPGIHHYSMSRLLAKRGNPITRWIFGHEPARYPCTSK